MRFLKVSTILIGLLASLSSFAGEELKFSGGVSAMGNIMAKIEKPFQEKTGIKIVYTQADPKGVGGDAVLKEVDSGKAEVGASGAVWDDWLKLMAEKNYKIQHQDEFKTRVLGTDRIQFMTYKKGPKKLTSDQIKDLLTGAVTNWKQVGGEDKPVLLVLSSKQPNTEKFLNERFLKDKKVKQEGAMKLDDSKDITAMTATIASTPGAFGFGPVNSVTEAVNVPDQPVVGRPITFIWRGKPSKNAQALFDFISKEGKNFGVMQ
jgi:phosphate transport system substrate-binding protein